MKLLPILLTLAAAVLVQAEDNQLFNGKDLTGWEGNPKLWSVQDGAITGKTANEGDAKIKHNTFLVWKGGTVGDFELTFKYRIEKGNSGLQYRSKELPAGENGPIISGYQADFEAGKTYSGILYEERGRGILAKRGEKIVIKADAADPKKAKIEVTGSVGNSDEIQAAIKHEEWNDFKIIAKGGPPSALHQWQADRGRDRRNRSRREGGRPRAADPRRAGDGCAVQGHAA